MAGGAHRGPVEIRRQRRTVRFVQGLLVLIGASLLVFAGYSMGRSESVRSDDLVPPRDPGAAQTIVLSLLGLGTLGLALGLQGSGGVRLPTPHSLRDFERSALERDQVPAGTKAEHTP